MRKPKVIKEGWFYWAVALTIQQSIGRPGGNRMIVNGT